jgi:hypothetical protein
MIDEWFYNKLKNDTDLIILISSRVYSEYADYDLNIKPFITYYDTSEVYTKYNTIRQNRKSVKVVSDSKLNNVEICNSLLNLLNTDITEKFIGVDLDITNIISTKVVSCIHRKDEINNSWVSTLDLIINYE